MTGFGIYTLFSNTSYGPSSLLSLKARHRKVIRDAFFSLVQRLLFVCPFINQKLGFEKDKGSLRVLHQCPFTLYSFPINSAIITLFNPLVLINGFEITMRSKTKT